MADSIYDELRDRFARMGGRYPGMDIPEFYELAEALFTLEEATSAAAMPRGLSTAEQRAETLNKDATEVADVLKGMARKGLCMSVDVDGTPSYTLPPFVPGIFEYQFMRGTKTERDLKLARLIHQFKEAVDAINGVPEIAFPTTRVIPVDATIEAGHTVHTYDQVSTYIETADPISLVTCYCRHEAELIDPEDSCGKPNEVCISFGIGARFNIEQGFGRQISKQEAMEILKRSEEEGLVHCSVNRQDLQFICNCCPDHCVILKTALAQEKPGLAINSGFQPSVDAEECNGCELCVEDCPAGALSMAEDDLPALDLDRCIGCGVCATSCPMEAIRLVAKPGHPEPPVDQNALRDAYKSATAS
jgi:Pyruvate/2-oxoacid:ferredoxin oxidoreductase delta subunit